MKHFTRLHLLLLLLLGGLTAHAQFSESFDGTDTPDGWTVLNLGDDNTWLFGPPIDGSTHSGFGDAHISYSSTAHDDYLITPQISVTAGVSDQLRFYSRNNGTFFVEKFNLLVSTTGTDAIDFTDTLANQVGPPDTWTEYVYDLTSYVGQDIYIAFQATSTDEFRLHIDDVFNENIPACPKPGDLTSSVTSTTSADISWTENGDATEWNVIYGEAGFDPETEGTTVGDNNGTPGITISDLLPETAYEFYVRAICGPGDESDLSVMGEFYTGYCVYSGTNTTFYLDGFWTSGGTENISNPGTGDAPIGYANYTDQAVSTFATGIVSFTATFGSGTNGLNIYVDWNDDMIFEDSEIAYSTGTTVTEASGFISVPAGTANGDYRMRVVSDWLSASPPACGENEYGEAEDYTFTVIDPPSCLPPTDLVVESVSFVSAEVSWTENGSATQWEVTYGIAGFDPETEGTTVIDDDGTPGTILVDLTEETAYDFYVRAICGNENESDFSISGNLFTGYCVFSGTDPSYYIDNFSTTLGIENISNLGTGDAPTGYASYTDQVVSQFATGSVDFVTSFSSGTYGFNIYIDWDNNMAFDESEKVYGSGAYVANASGSIAVPAGTANGDYRMRIVCDWLDTDPPACGGSDYAEAEDYTFSVVDPPSCLPPTFLVVDNFTTDNADVNWTENGSATTWEIVYGESGFDPATEGTTLTDDDGTPGANIPGLTENTQYDFYVRTICGTDDESVLVGPITFTTLCDPTNVTYMEDFNSATPPELPACTTKENVGTGNDWVTYDQNANGFSSIVLRYRYSVSNEANAWFYTQGINLVAGTDYQISYKYGNNSSTYVEKLKVSYGTGSQVSEMVNELADYPNISLSGAATDTVYFTVDVDGVFYFGFNAYSDANQYYLYLDDIVIKEVVGCEAPSDIAISDIDATSATLSWTESSTATEGYSIEVFTTGANPDTDPPVFNVAVGAGSSSVGITGLTEATTYDAYVTSDCGGSEAMSDVVTFTTSTTGMNELGTYGLSYYPNPVKNILNVSADTQIQDITVYNLLGKKVIQTKPESVTVTLDMSALASGSYLVKVTINNSVSTYKLMKN